MMDSVFNALEIYNEGTLLITTLMMIGFTQYSPNDRELTKFEENDMRSKIGWVIIAIVSIYILINMFFILKGLFLGLKKALGAKLSTLRDKFRGKVKKENLKDRDVSLLKIENVGI